MADGNCTALGLPVAETLLIEHTRIDGAEVSLNVQQRLPGIPLHRLGLRGTGERGRSLTEEAGLHLAHLHGVVLAQRGAIDQEGSAWPEATAPVSLDRTRELVDLLGARGVASRLLQRAEALIAESATLLATAPIRLLHGDWSVANLLSDGERITGVVDWSGARGGDPASELSGWEFWADHGPTALSNLLRGYRSAGAKLMTSSTNAGSSTASPTGSTPCRTSW